MKKNRHFLLCVLIVACTLLFSCEQENKHSIKVDYLPFKMEKGERWGMLKPDGTALFKDEFEDTPSPCINGVFFIRNDKGFTLYTASEKPKPIKNCENLKYVGIMSEGIIPIVAKGERIKYVDINGNEKFTLKPYKNKEIIGVSPFFTDGLAVIETSDGKKGYINTLGEVVIEPKYDEAYRFSFGRALVTKEKDGESSEYRYIIDTKGNIIKKLGDNVELESPFDGKYFIASKDERVVLLNDKGEITKKFPSKVKEVQQVLKNDSYIYLNDENEYGVNDKNDEIIIRAKYKHVRPLENNYYLVIYYNSNDEYKINIIDNEGNIVKELDDYTDIIYGGGNVWAEYGIDEFWNNVFIGRTEGNKYELMDLEGELISKEEYIIDMDENYFFDVDDLIESDYFDGNGMADNIVSSIKDNSIGNIYLGTNLSDILTDQSVYNYEKQILFNDISSDECNINLGNGIISQVTTISVIPINDYYFNYNNAIQSAKIEIIALGCQLFEEEEEDRIKNTETLIRIVKDKLINTGYKVVNKGKYAFELSKENRTLIITPVISDSGVTFAIYLLKSSDMKMMRTLKDMDSEYIEKKERYNEGDDDFYEVEVEVAEASPTSIEHYINN